MTIRFTDHPDHLEVICDGCRSAHIYCKAPTPDAALQYITARRWSVVVMTSGDVVTICPSCTYRRKDPEHDPRSYRPTGEDAPQ